MATLLHLHVPSYNGKQLEVGNFKLLTIPLIIYIPLEIWPYLIS